MISEFFGRFHPVIVHLPVGILLLASLFLILIRKERYQWLQPVINIILLAGMITAILSCITGFLLSQNGEYEGSLVNTHQWLGISLAVVSGLAYFVRRKKIYLRWQWTFGALMIILLLITGHQGGSLTHGEDYLKEPLASLFGDSSAKAPKRKPIPDIQEAMAYNDVIQPILEDKCYACHGMSKQKGKLRMDHPALLMKGGENGEIIIPGKATESEMIKRILLPISDEHHMAPKNRTQVTTQEKQLLQWWVDNDADFIRKVKDIPQPQKIAPVLLALQLGHEPKIRMPEVPETPVEKADKVAIQKLRDAGIVALPVSQNSNYLSANFVLASNSSDEIMQLLLPVKKQLVWLKLGNTNIGDKSMEIIAQCTNLTKLHLENTNVTDKGVAALDQLKKLQSLNLVGTNVTTSGLTALKDLKDLQSLYLYKTDVQQDDWSKLKKMFSASVPDSGGYRTAFLATDTMKLK